LLDEVRAQIERILEARKPLPFETQVEKELDRLEKRALAFSAENSHSQEIRS
jgi:hypothetical protein